MANIGSSNQGSNFGFDGGGGGLPTGLAGVVGVAATVDLFFVAPALGACLLGYLIFLGVYLAVANRTKNLARLGLVNALACASAIAACIGGVLAANGAGVSLSTVGWIVTALYIASLLAGALAAFGALMRILSIAASVVMIVATVTIANKEAAEQRDQWRIVLHVEDADGDPLPDAYANCIAIASEDLAGEFEIFTDFTQLTDESGEAEFEFQYDSQFKAAVCGAVRDPRDNRPRYRMRTAVMASPLPGGEYHLRLQLVPDR